MGACYSRGIGHASRQPAPRTKVVPRTAKAPSSGFSCVFHDTQAAKHRPVDR